MMREKLIIVTIVVLLSACTQDSTPSKESIRPSSPYFGLQPDSIPRILKPGFLASPAAEYNGTFSPDGKEFYYTTVFPGKDVLTFTELQADNSWSKPAIASFSGEYIDYDPLFSPDGNRIYFSSRRPVIDSIDDGQSNNWYVERTRDGWSTPQYIKLTDRGDYYNSITKEGIIYFNTWSDGDIYKATPSENGYIIDSIKAEFNNGRGVGDPFISADEDYLIYRGYDGSLGRGDLYICFNRDGGWTKPQNLGEPINSETHEMCPWVSPDGEWFVFASGRLQNEWPQGPGQSLDSMYTKYASFDNGQLNMFYMSAGFIEKFRTTAVLE